jgi:flagellar protein FliT
MDARSALTHYRQAHETTRGMLAAAKGGDWEGLVNLEIARRAALDDLTAQAIDFNAGLLRQEKDACIREILEMDAQIRTLTEAWMGEMRQMLVTVQSQRKIEQAYGAR